MNWSTGTVEMRVKKCASDQVDRVARSMQTCRTFRRFCFQMQHQRYSQKTKERRLRIKFPLSRPETSKIRFHFESASWSVFGDTILIGNYHRLDPDDPHVFTLKTFQPKSDFCIIFRHEPFNGTAWDVPRHFKSAICALLWIEAISYSIDHSSMPYGHFNCKISSPETRIHIKSHQFNYFLIRWWLYCMARVTMDPWKLGTSWRSQSNWNSPMCKAFHCLKPSWTT